MKIKINKQTAFTVGILLFSVISGFVLAQIPEGTQFFRIVNQTTGENVTTIDREGNLNATGNLQADGDLYIAGSVYTPNDAIAEALLDFDTSCASGSHLYVNGNDLACEIDQTGNTSAEIQAAQTINTSAEVEAAMNDSYDYFEILVNETLYVDCNDIYGSPDADFCTDADSGGADVYVNETGDTMTGDLVMNGGDINLTANTDRIRDHTTGLSMYFDSGWVIEVN